MEELVTKKAYIVNLMKGAMYVQTITVYRDDLVSRTFLLLRTREHPDLRIPGLYLLRGLGEGYTAVYDGNPGLS